MSIQEIQGPLSAAVKRSASQDRVFSNLPDTAKMKPHKVPPKKRMKTGLKTKDRPQSENIEDNRAYFGSDALDSDYSDEDRQRDFVMDAIHNPVADAPRKFRKKPEKLWDDHDWDD